MSEQATPVRVVFFASLRELTGESEIQFSASDLGSLLTHLKERYAAEIYAELTAENVRIAVDQELLEAQPNLAAVSLAPGSEVAFLPPVTGG